MINRVVFDLDSLICPTVENEPPLMQDSNNPVAITASDDGDVLVPALQDLAVLETLSSEEEQGPQIFSDISEASTSASEGTVDTCSTIDCNPPHLEFESRFESGNLRKAIQVSSISSSFSFFLT